MWKFELKIIWASSFLQLIFRDFAFRSLRLTVRFAFWLTSYVPYTEHVTLLYDMHLHATLLHCYIVWYALGPNLPGRSDREARLARWWKDDSGETGQDVETSKQDIFKVVIQLTTFVSSQYLTPSNSRISTQQLKKITIIILPDMLWILSHTRHIKMDKLTGNTWTHNSYLYFQFFNFVRNFYFYIAYNK